MKITFDNDYISELLITECHRLKTFKEGYKDGFEIGFCPDYDEDHKFIGMTISCIHPDKEIEKIIGELR